MSDGKLKITYETVPLADLVNYFVRGYQQPNEIESHEYFVDVLKGEVVLRLFVREKVEP